MKIMNLTLANFRNGKSASVSLFILILVATFLLNVGLMVITQIGTFYDNKVEQLKDPHMTVWMDRESYHSTYEDFIADYPEVIETEVEDILNMSIATFNSNDSELSYNVVLFNADAHRNIGPLNMIEKRTAKGDSDIYVPYSLKTNSGYELGDDFSITYQNKEYKYKIAGFFETTTMGTNNIGVMKFMLPEPGFLTLAEELDKQSQAVMVSAVLEDTAQVSTITNDLIQEVQQSGGEEPAYIWGLDIGVVKNVNTLTVNIIAMILVAFAAIIVLVSLIVIRFRVSNSIEDGMTNIGALKAIGYTSRQILSSILLQFILIGLCASVVGIAMSYILMPIIGNIISTLTGLLWVQKFDFIINLISILLILFSVVTVTLLSAFRVRKILPIAALRGGVQTHSFRKNYFPLEKARGGLHFLLGMKSMLANARQNIMILLIIIALTFASVFSVVLYYNITADKTEFVNLFGAEPANVMINVHSDENTKELIHDIEEMDHVSKVNLFDLIDMKIDDQIVYTNITDDYSQLENNIVYEGRHPKYENEISISWVIADQINKGIGDTVEVEYGGKTADFLVTGLSQSISNLGLVAGLTMEGIQELQSDYKGTTLNVYLDGIPNREFMEKVEEEYGTAIVEILDIDENIESQTGMYADAVFAVMMIVLTITIVVVVMILSLVCKTIIIKRKKEFGVMKAIGYSTIQLMHQISISFLPVVVTGALIGGLLGLYFTNPLLSLLLSTAGVKRLDFTAQSMTVMMICVGIIVLAYIVSIFVSRRIKKISAYGLIVE